LEKPRGGLTGRTFHLVVEDRYNRAYWLHLEVDAKKTLDTLDSFLWDIAGRIISPYGGKSTTPVTAKRTGTKE